MLASSVGILLRFLDGFGQKLKSATYSIIVNSKKMKKTQHLHMIMKMKMKIYLKKKNVCDFSTQWQLYRSGHQEWNEDDARRCGHHRGYLGLWISGIP